MGLHKSYSVWFLLLSFGGQAVARQEPWTHYGVRPLAMGNAFVSIADDYNALFYNPAGLANLKDWRFEILNMSAIQSASNRKFVQKISNISSHKSSQTQEIINLIQENPNEIQHYSVGIRPYFVRPGFGIGASIQTGGDVRTHNYPSIDLNVGLDAMLVVGYGAVTANPNLSFGTSVKWHVVEKIDQELSVEYFQAIQDLDEESRKQSIQKYFKAGYGLGFDLGMLYRGKGFRPNLGISLSSVGGMSYQPINVKEHSLGHKTPAPPSLNFGMSMNVLNTEAVQILIASDCHKVNQNISYGKKLSFGSEIAVMRLVKIQLGLRNNLVSWGVQAEDKLLSIRVGQYSEELGETVGDATDRRWMVELKIII